MTEITNFTMIVKEVQLAYHVWESYMARLCEEKQECTQHS